MKWAFAEDETPRGPMQDIVGDDEDNNSVSPFRDLQQDAPELLRACGFIKKKRFTCNYPNFEGMFSYQCLC
jgi:hypothetical protein